MICKLLAMSIIASSPEAINDALKLREIGFSYELENFVKSGRVDLSEPYEMTVEVLDHSGKASKIRILQSGDVVWTRKELDVVCDES
ncbi:MAG: hypothetical protein GOVbin631_58 [Prokaryotic dsDNA virus sp.]|nr:MAG: hypothetical protein GOVbin631_58 [Prokaryotic dsDNA virus sp.]|tara:strand:- start:22698 stop:22958 length:261 start_codon:yes stop_codon:yes gene_type:complete